MKKLIVGEKYHDTHDNEIFEVVSIDGNKLLVKFENMARPYLVDADGSVRFPLKMMEDDYNNGIIKKLN